MAATLRLMAGAPGDGAPGDISGNLSAILKVVAKATGCGVQALVLPELCLSSSGCADLFRHELLTDACRDAARDIAAACGDMVCVLGLPVWARNGLLNAAAVILRGEVKAFAVKQNLSRSQRAFFTPDVPDFVEWFGKQVPCGARPIISLSTGEQLMAAFWDDLLDGEQVDPSFFTLSPAAFPALAGGYGQALHRARVLTQGGATLALANAGANESTTDEVFGGEALIARGGEILSQSARFRYEPAIADCTHHGKVGAKSVEPAQPPAPAEPFLPPQGPRREAWCRDCVEIPAQALAVRMRRIGSKAATLGVSGGLDSALALLITRRAFGLLGMDKGNIIACSLPGLGTGERTRRNARRLIEAMGLTPREIDIRASVLKHFEDIGHAPDRLDTAFENAQARERTQVLMDLANMHGGLMVGTGDLSELALGFTTFGGDHLSMYCVNAGLYKTAIRHAVRQAALDAGEGLLRDTLLDILATPVSPELLPGEDGTLAQETERIVGPYALNDFFLHHFLTSWASPGKLLRLAREALGDMYARDELIGHMKAFFTRFFASQFKRNCLCDGPRVLEASLSPRGAFALPSDVSAALYLDALESL